MLEKGNYDFILSILLHYYELKFLCMPISINSIVIFIKTSKLLPNISVIFYLFLSLFFLCFIEI